MLGETAYAIAGEHNVHGCGHACCATLAWGMARALRNIHPRSRAKIRRVDERKGREERSGTGRRGGGYGGGGSCGKQSAETIGNGGYRQGCKQHREESSGQEAAG